jgi:hypothetical protein
MTKFLAIQGNDYFIASLWLKINNRKVLSTFEVSNLFFSRIIYSLEMYNPKASSLNR